MTSDARPAWDTERVQELIRQVMGDLPAALSPLAEGEDSQPFRFCVRGDWYVLRLNRSADGFYKDAYAARRLGGPDIPIPRMVQAGRAGADAAYAISEYICGTTLQALDDAAVRAALPHVLDLHRAIRQVDVTGTTGCGPFGPDGAAARKSWREWLLQTGAVTVDGDALDREDSGLRDLHPVPVLADAFNTFSRLVEMVPEERTLYHGDFGSNNLLIREGRVAGVLDWDQAGYGDWLYDVAGACYWRPHLRCMELAWRAYESWFAALPSYRARIQCYALHIGLSEASEAWQARRPEWLAWHLERLRALVLDARDL